MKQTNKLPRRVGFSLLKSLVHTSEILARCASLSVSTYPSRMYHKMVESNEVLFTQKDIDAFANISKFNQEVRDTVLGESKKMPTGSFISVAKHSKPDLKYVSTPTSVGLVVTTGLLKRMLHLSTVAGLETKGNTKAEEHITYACEHGGGYYTYEQNALHFIRLADIVRYFGEIQGNLIEISLEGMQNDYKLEKRQDRYYGRADSENSALASSMYPMVSDRYQEESWKHYLTTSYAGMCNVDKVYPPNTHLSKNILLGELKTLEV